MKYTSKLILNGTEYAFGAESGWQPGADTVLYYDFEHTSGTTETDVAGNYNGTYSSTPTISTLSSGKKYFENGGNNYLYTNNKISTLDYNNATVCIWINQREPSYSWFGQQWWGVQSSGTILISGYQTVLGASNNEMNAIYDQNNWINITIVNDGVNTTSYKNGVQVETKNITSATGTNYLYIGGSARVNESGQEPTINVIGNAYFGSVILENKAWTAQEISDYYNQTKSLYGIS